MSCRPIFYITKTWLYVIAFGFGLFCNNSFAIERLDDVIEYQDQSARQAVKENVQNNLNGAKNSHNQKKEKKKKKQPKTAPESSVRDYNDAYILPHGIQNLLDKKADKKHEEEPVDLNGKLKKESGAAVMHEKKGHDLKHEKHSEALENRLLEIEKSIISISKKLEDSGKIDSDRSAINSSDGKTEKEDLEAKEAKDISATKTEEKSAEQIKLLNGSVDDLKLEISKISDSIKRQEGLIKSEISGYDSMLKAKDSLVLKPYGTIVVNGSNVVDRGTSSQNLFGGFNVRALRMGMIGKMRKQTEYHIAIDFAGNQSRIIQGYVGYEKSSNLVFQFGFTNEPFGLENTTSIDNLVFNDRSTVSVFYPGRNVGFVASKSGKSWSNSFGVFDTNKVSGAPNGTGSDSYSISNRLTFAPVYVNDQNYIHAGYNLNFRKNNGFNFALPLEVRLPSSTFTSGTLATGSVVSGNNDNVPVARLSLFDTQNIFTHGPEFVYNYNKFSLRSELNLSRIEFTGSGTSNFNAYYIGASYLLSNARRPYNPSRGNFRQPVADKDFEIEGDGWGAFELTVRYSHLNLNSRNLPVGYTTDNVIFGFNWYLDRFTRVSLNYMTASTTSRINNNQTLTSAPKVIGVTTSMRFQ